jgi:hypothetical protein
MCQAHVWTPHRLHVTWQGWPGFDFLTSLCASRSLPSRLRGILFDRAINFPLVVLRHVESSAVGNSCPVELSQQDGAG